MDDFNARCLRMCCDSSRRITAPSWFQAEELASGQGADVFKLRRQIKGIREKTSSLPPTSLSSSASDNVTAGTEQR